VNRGEVWTVEAPDAPGRRWRVAVVSADSHNDRPGALPFVVPVVHRPGGDLPPFTATLADPDPVGGVALVGDMSQLDPCQGAERVGMLTGASMTRIGAAIRDLFEL
jgi:mRNA interferase MazF